MRQPTHHDLFEQYNLRCASAVLLLEPGCEPTVSSSRCVACGTTRLAEVDRFPLPLVFSPFRQRR